MSDRPHVVVVEDEPLVRAMMETALEDEGYALTLLDTAGAALQLLEADGMGLRCLVTDVDLGSAVDGFEIARRAVAKRPDLKVIYVSGGSQHRFEKEHVPGSQMFTKPFDLNAVVAAVRDGVEHSENRT